MTIEQVKEAISRLLKKIKRLALPRTKNCAQALPRQSGGASGKTAKSLPESHTTKSNTRTLIATAHLVSGLGVRRASISTAKHLPIKKAVDGVQPLEESRLFFQIAF